MGRRFTISDFVKKSCEVHGDKYDYTETVYVNSHSLAKIICPEHGPFYQKPIYHYMGSGCPLCGEKKRAQSKTKSTEKFIDEAKKIHGDKYDYSKVEYIGNNKKVCIICPEHGEFWIKPNNHLSEKQGCPVCGGTKKLTTDEFILRARKIHGDKYDYSKVKYVNNETKVCIICHEKDEFGDEHGEFWQTPHHHLSGFGCKKCSKNYMDTDMFIKKANKVHCGVYDYAKTVYKNNSTKVLVTCKKHGDFMTTPTDHIRGRGCPVCEGSNSEKIIYSFLTNNGVKFEFQKTFDWLKYRKNLFVDFFITDKNIAIEYQGEQHFKPVKYSNKTKEDVIEEHRTIKKRDKIKEELCKQHGIKVEYITFNDDIIERLNHILYEPTS